ncbi:hypothetical protein [Chryseobacterium sp. Leaf405]|uniref:hypothetical protein n=1 Tax=Chryseobacterium sp. Leaf405 TaxID=1736367 RepID=UPI000B0077A7|nr:hypothetical protein [Chryseobacterium sp. Leaf405]
MKYFFINIMAVSFINSCTPSSKSYEGYIYNHQKKPLENIKVCEQNKNNCTYTNDKGFFQLRKDKNSIGDLLVFNRESTIDTIKTVWSQHGEKINFSFIEGKNDTLFIDFK